MYLWVLRGTQLASTGRVRTVMKRRFHRMRMHMQTYKASATVSSVSAAVQAQAQTAVNEYGKAELRLLGEMRACPARYCTTLTGQPGQSRCLIKVCARYACCSGETMLHCLSCCPKFMLRPDVTFLLRKESSSRRTTARHAQKNNSTTLGLGPI